MIPNYSSCIQCKIMLWIQMYISNWYSYFGCKFVFCINDSMIWKIEAQYLISVCNINCLWVSGKLLVWTKDLCSVHSFYTRNSFLINMWFITLNLAWTLSTFFFFLVNFVVLLRAEIINSRHRNVLQYMNKKRAISYLNPRVVQ